MNGIKFQQMRVHRRIAHRIIDKGDLGPAFQQGAQGNFTDPAKAVKCIGCHDLFLCGYVFADGVDVFLQGGAIQRFERQRRKSADPVVQRAIGLVKGKTLFRFGSFGFHRVRHAPMA